MKDYRDVPSAPPWGRRGLDAGTRRIARSALEAILCDEQNGQIVAPAPDWVDRVLDDYDLSVGNAGPQVRLGLRALWRALEWLPLGSKIGRMSALSLPDRVAFLDGVEHHRFAAVTMIFIALKVPSTLSAFEEGEPLRETGFDRPTTSSRRRLPVSEGP
jgi:hypothetical protein